MAHGCSIAKAKPADTLGLVAAGHRGNLRVGRIMTHTVVGQMASSGTPCARPLHLGWAGYPLYPDPRQF